MYVLDRSYLKIAILIPSEFALCDFDIFVPGVEESNLEIKARLRRSLPENSWKRGSAGSDEFGSFIYIYFQTHKRETHLKYPYISLDN